MLRRRFDIEYRTFVCFECAGERSKLYSKAPVDLRALSGGQEDLAEWAGELLGCEVCGSDLTLAAEKVEPGCCHCYVRFESVLENAIRAAQGTVRHPGKTPGR